MDILTQTFLNKIIDFFVKSWSIETMIIICIFILALYFMKIQIDKYKMIASLLQKDIERTTEELRNCHQSLLEIKQILITKKQEEINDNLLKEIENIIKAYK